MDKRSPAWVIQKVRQTLDWAIAESATAGQEKWQKQFNFLKSRLENQPTSDRGEWIAQLLDNIVKGFNAKIVEIDNIVDRQLNGDNVYNEFRAGELIIEELEYLKYLSKLWFTEPISILPNRVIPLLVKQSNLPNEEARLAFSCNPCDFCCSDARKATDRIGSGRAGISHSCDVHKPRGPGRHSRARSMVTKTARRIVQNDGFAGENWPDHWRKMIEVRMRLIMTQVISDPESDEVLQAINELADRAPTDTVSIWAAFPRPSDRDREVREIFRSAPKQSILEASAALARSPGPAWASLVPGWHLARHIALKELYALDPGPKKTPVQQDRTDCLTRAVTLVLNEECGVNEAARRTGLNKSVVSRHVKRANVERADR